MILILKYDFDIKPAFNHRNDNYACIIQVNQFNQVNQSSRQ